MAGLEDLTPEQRQELNLGRLTKQLLANPETAETVQRLLPKADPKLRFPEVEIKDNLAKVREETNDRVKALEEELRKSKAEARLEKLHGRVREAGLELKPVVELMEKHGLAPTEENYDMAIEVLRSRTQVAEPTSSGIQPLEMPNIKEMWADPVKWRENEAAKVLKEMRGGKLIQ
jgi:hypothetical protein